MGRPRQTHCKRGHALTPENTYVSAKTGFRQCRACGRMRYGREGHVPWTPPEMPDDPAVLAYAAGIIDGEGTIGIKLQGNGTGRRYHTYTVRVANTDRRMVNWLRDHFGGSISETQQQGGRKAAYHWTLTSGSSGAFLEAIRPFLVTKGEQADVALALRATKKRANGATGSAVTVEVFEHREQLRQRMAVLNRRGAG